MPLHHYSGYDCASAHSRPGTYADVYWIKEAQYEAFDDYAATIDTNEARAAIARFEVGGLGRSPPRYNCTACPLVSLKCDLNVQCLLTSLRLANLLTYFTAFASYAQGRFSNRSGVYFDGCHLCANGTFSNDRNGATVCTPCPPGSYQRSSGSTSCEGCPAGRFMNTTGDGFACDACPRGRSTNGETGYAVCSRCSELNSPAEEGFDSVTKCFNRMQCGKVGGDY